LSNKIYSHSNCIYVVIYMSFLEHKTDLNFKSVERSHKNNTLSAYTRIKK